MTEQDVTYEYKINELRLTISHPNSEGLAFVLVEGDTDIRLFRKLFDLESCKVERIPGGNTKVEDCVEELLNRTALVIGIRDADFIHLNNIDYTKRNIFLTDLHDIEMTLVAESEVFSAIIFEFTNIKENKHDSIRNDIMSYIEKISLLKWLDSKERLGLKFKEVGFQDLLAFSGTTLDFSAYFRRLVSKSPNAVSTDFDNIVEKIEKLKLQNPDSYQLCNGHDFMKSLAAFLRQKGNGKSISDDILASIFRTNYRQDFYRNTTLFRQTKEWSETVNCSIYS